MVQMRKNRMSYRPKCFCSFRSSTSATVSSSTVLVIQDYPRGQQQATSSPRAISSLSTIDDSPDQVAQVGQARNPAPFVPLPWPPGSGPEASATIGAMVSEILDR